MTDTKMSEVDYRIRAAVLSDRSCLANLIHFGTSIHQHLDWKSPLDWLGRSPYFVVETDNGCAAALACPPELPGVTWIRLFAVTSHIPINFAWKLLWEAAQGELARETKYLVAALSLQNWFNNILESSGFEHADNVIVLMRGNSFITPDPKPGVVNIRPMLIEDLPEVVKVDHSSFSLEWRNSQESLELAFQQTSIATIAETESEIVGYQYSTTGAVGGHLARLAVKPSHQGNGIGYALLHDLLKQFNRWDVKNVTVNTQQKNQISLSLYEKAGFKPTGESYRIYRSIL